MNLNQIIAILKSRKILILVTMIVMSLMTTIISLVLPKQYTATAVIAIDTVKVDPISNIPLSGQLVSGYLATQVDIIGSHNTALKVIELLGLNKIPELHEQYIESTDGKGKFEDWLADTLLKNIDIKQSRESNTISIEYTAVDPSFSALLANTFVEAYKVETVDMRNQLAQQNRQFFEQQLKVLQKKLSVAQKKLADYQQSTGIVASDERLDIENQHLADLSNQLVVAQGAYYDALSRKKAAGSDSVAPDVLNNPLIQQLKSQVSINEAKFKQVAAKEGLNNPAYHQALAELNSSKAQLNHQIQQYSTSLNTTAENAGMRMKSIQTALEEQKNKVLQLKSARSQSDVLLHEVENAQQIYQIAMQKLSEFSLESKSDMTNVNILQSAPEPIKASKPKVLLNIILSIILGMMLGIVIALIKEMSDRRIRLVDDLAKYSQLRVLTKITLSKD